MTSWKFLRNKLVPVSWRSSFWTCKVCGTEFKDVFTSIVFVMREVTKNPVRHWEPCFCCLNAFILSKLGNSDPHNNLHWKQLTVLLQKWKISFILPLLHSQFIITSITTYINDTLIHTISAAIRGNEWDLSLSVLGPQIGPLSHHLVIKTERQIIEENLITYRAVRPCGILSTRAELLNAKH
jgi:hypothetical protein